LAYINKKGGFKLIQNNNKMFKRGDVILVDLGSRDGSVEYGTRPCAVLGNSNSNLYSPAITVSPLSTSMSKINKKIPTHVLLTPLNSGVRKESVVMLEQILTIDKSWIVKDKPLFELNDEQLSKINECLMIQFNLMNYINTMTSCSITA